MNEEDEAFEDLAKRQGDWGMQGSRKHQIMRYAENVENKGTSMTDKEALIERLATTCHGLDPIDPLRLLVDDVVAALAQPEQEPVAWMYDDDYQRMLTSETFCKVWSLEVGSAKRGVTTVPLYAHPPQRTEQGSQDWKTPPKEDAPLVKWAKEQTTPPQRKPLSTEQVNEICAEWTTQDGNTGYFGLRQIVRAIEAAHGIKENT